MRMERCAGEHIGWRNQDEGRSGRASAARRPRGSKPPHMKTSTAVDRKMEELSLDSVKLRERRVRMGRTSCERSAGTGTAIARLPPERACGDAEQRKDKREITRIRLVCCEDIY